MDTECIPGPTGIATKASLSNASNTAKEWRGSPTETATREIIKTASHAAMESITGPLAVFSRDSSRMDSDADKGFGKKGQAEAINMREDGRRIRRRAMACLLGQTVLFTRVSLPTI